jgi:hypothetical protein
MAPHCCPIARSAPDESSHPTLPRVLHRLALGVAAPVTLILDLYSAAPPGVVAASQPLCHNALEAELRGVLLQEHEWRRREGLV